MTRHFRDLGRDPYLGADPSTFYVPSRPAEDDEGYDTGWLGPAFAGIERFGSKWIREPMSAAMTYASLIEADREKDAPWWGRALQGLKEPVDWFNVDRWREASGIAEDRSMGRSMMLAALTNNIRDPAQVAAAQESQLYRKGSGAVDFAGRVTVDPFAVMGGPTVRALMANTVQRGGPGLAAGIRSAASRNRLGLQSPQRWLGPVDPPDAIPSLRLQERAERGGTGAYYSDTPRYLDEVRAARAERITAHVDERSPTTLRTGREGVWRNAIQRRAPILEDGYVVPMRVHRAGEVHLGPIPEHGVLVQLDEAGQIVGKPLHAVGDRTPVNHPTIWSTLLGGPSKRKGWWWLHDDLDTLAFKVSLTGEEVAASKVDDLLERFDSILPDDEWRTMQVPRSMEGGVFTGTAAEGKTLQEIGEMARNGQELRLSRNRLEVYDVLELDRLRRNSLSPEEIKAIWPTVRRIYADEAVDNILTARDDMDTMRLRALFYDDPTMAGNQTVVGAIHDFVDRGQRKGLGVGGLEEWAEVVQSSETQLAGFGQIRDLIVADLRAVTRQFVDDVGMPKRVSVGRWQEPGAPIGASGSTWPMDPQWAGKVTTGNPANPESMRYGLRGPTFGGGTKEWFEAVVDPRKDIDFFMLSRTGHNYAEHEILMSPAKWAEKTVAGLADEPIPFSKEWDRIAAGGLGGRRTRDMPGLTSSQIEFGPNAPKWIQRALDEMEAVGTEPDLIKRFIKEPAGAAREALASRVRSELNVGRRNLLEAEGWTNLPTPGALRVKGGTTMYVQINDIKRYGADVVEQIASGKFDQADWFRFGSHYDLPSPPNWSGFSKELVDIFSTRPRPETARLAFKEWVNTGDPNATAQSLSGIVDWTVREGTKASMELLPGWQDELKKLVDDWYRTGYPPL